MFAAAAVAAAGLMADGVLLVVPANQMLVDLGFVLMRMKPAGAVEMVCYSGTDEVQTMELFDRGQWRWMEIPQTAWVNGSLRSLSRDALVIVGDGQAATDLLDTASWADNILTPDGHAMHELANAVHSVSPLTRKQWKTLEKNYGITYREIAAPSRYDRGDRYSRGDRAAEPAVVMTRRNAAEPQFAPPEIDLSQPTVVVVTEDAPAAPAAEAPVAEAPAVAAPAADAPVAAPEEKTVVGEKAAPAAVEPAPAAAPALEAAPEAPAASVETAAEAVTAAAETAAAAAGEGRRTVQEAIEKAKAEVEGAAAAE